MTLEPYWTTTLLTLSTLIFAVLGLYITFQQRWLAHNKLQFDLFDRRLTVYNAARTLLTSIMTLGKATEKDVYEYMIATGEAKWLFKDSIAEYLHTQLYNKINELQALGTELNGANLGEEHSKNASSKTEIKKWLVAQYEVLDENFSPFLQLKDLTSHWPVFRRTNR